MKGNEIIIVLVGMLVAVVALGFVLYCWCHRHVTSGVTIIQAQARLKRDRVNWDTERGEHVDPYIPRFTREGWVRAKRPRPQRVLREPEYVILRTVRSGNAWSDQCNRAPPLNREQKPRRQQQRQNNQNTQQSAGQHQQKGKQQKQQKEQSENPAPLNNLAAMPPPSPARPAEQHNDAAAAWQEAGGNQQNTNHGGWSTDEWSGKGAKSDQAW